MMTRTSMNLNTNLYGLLTYVVTNMFNFVCSDSKNDYAGKDYAPIAFLGTKEHSPGRLQV